MVCPICNRPLNNSGTKYYIQEGNEKLEVCPVCYVRIALLLLDRDGKEN